jgi:hypothetical protein
MAERDDIKLQSSEQSSQVDFQDYASEGTVKRDIVSKSLYEELSSRLEAISPDLTASISELLPDSHKNKQLLDIGKLTELAGTDSEKYATISIELIRLLQELI